MNQSKTTFQYALNYGLALGATLSAIELIAYFLGLVTKPVMSFIYFVLIVTMITIALRKFRDQLNNGFLSFGQAFLIGLFTCLISGAIWAIFRMAEYSIVPSIIEEMLLTLEDSLLETRSMSEDQIESLMKLYNLFINPITIAISTFIFTMGFGGAILSLIMAAIFKREQNPLINNSNN